MSETFINLSRSKRASNRAFPPVPCINDDCGSHMVVDGRRISARDMLSWVSAENTFMCQVCSVRQNPKLILYSSQNRIKSGYGIAFEKAVSQHGPYGKFGNKNG